MKPLLSTRALAIRTTTAQLVEPLSIDLWPGKVLTIIGETGSGKSLFAQGIVGNLPAGLSAHGEIELAGGLREQGQASGRRAAWGRELAVLPQDCLLYTSPSPRDQRGSRMPSSA